MGPITWRRTLVCAIAVVELAHRSCNASVGRRGALVHLRGGAPRQDDEAGIAHMLLEPSFSKARSPAKTRVAFHDFGAGDEGAGRRKKRLRNEPGGQATDAAEDTAASMRSKDEYARAFGDLVLPDRYRGCNIQRHRISSDVRAMSPAPWPNCLCLRVAT
jgi:hypothetical protein